MARSALSDAAAAEGSAAAVVPVLDAEPDAADGLVRSPESELAVAIATRGGHQPNSC